jgi:hypothetical protein
MNKTSAEAVRTHAVAPLSGVDNPGTAALAPAIIIAKHAPAEASTRTATLLIAIVLQNR